MRLITKLSIAYIMGNILILSGCQNYVQPQQVVHKLASEPAKENTFQLDGKIGVRTAEQSGSAFFTWTQQDNYFNIDITGALGIGKTHIEGQPGQVTLTSAKTGTISASSAEELLEKATGWQTPITDLVQWVQAKTATNTAQTTTDSKNRLTNIVEDGWNVNLIYNDEIQTLPNKLVLKQVLPNEQENRITMVIQNRTMN
ncbi:lipoprotein insertase outer membrane protein LolB [Acinetobacter nectaris]|uniref:lipoprotein insertase outer membrane protein LolB n=1 Tax=Acinetobacter nectaris TaxID=1219382 RepID=UPI001EFF806D|nr:lipoprotein insertase outer membrane protein LolB [Acinetobacter nectaris]MCF9045203.1 outer membrane lipoprotein LolB [Acinetobacter nectaris]